MTAKLSHTLSHRISSNVTQAAFWYLQPVVIFKQFSSENSGDPNGTRTRVFGVKGRCPRPLDDGVVEDVAKDKEPENQAGNDIFLNNGPANGLAGH